MASHDFSRDFPKPTFCPWKSTTPEQEAIESTTAPAIQEQHEYAKTQHLSVNSGLDLLSNIAFLSGIIDSPTQCTSQSHREDSSVKSEHSVVSNTDQIPSPPSVSTTDITSKTNVDHKVKEMVLTNLKPINYLINTTQSKFNSSSSPVAPAMTTSHSHTQSLKTNNQPLESNHIGPHTSCSANQNVTSTANLHHVTFASTNQNRHLMNRDTPNASQSTCHFQNKVASDDPYANISHNRTDPNQRYPLSLFSNIPSVGQNVFPFGNMHHAMPPQRQRIPTALKEELKENMKNDQVLPWMFPVYHPIHRQIDARKETHPPVSVQNWLAETHKAAQLSEIGSKANQYSPPIPSTQPTTIPCSTSNVSTPMVISHPTSTPIFSRTAPPTHPRHVSSESTAAPNVSFRPMKTSMFTGKDEKITPRSLMSGSTALPEWLTTNMFPAGASFYQHPQARAMDSPVSDLDSTADSAFCSLASGDGSANSLDVNDMMHNDRSTPSSGIQSESSSLQNVSPGSSSDHSNQPCSSHSSSSPVFERHSSSSSESSSPTPRVQNTRSLFEKALSESIQTLSRQRVQQSPTIPTSGTCTSFTPQSSPAVAVGAGQTVINPDGADIAKKKSRTNYTPAQVRSLERVFLENPYPESLVMEQLSKDLNIPEQKLKVWFQNKRARWRKRVQENKVPPVHPIFMTPQSTYGMMRPPLAPGPFFPFPGDLNSGPYQSRPSFQPGLQHPRQMHSYTLQQFNQIR